MEDLKSGQKLHEWGEASVAAREGPTKVPGGQGQEPIAEHDRPRPKETDFDKYIRFLPKQQ